MSHSEADKEKPVTVVREAIINDLVDRIESRFAQLAAQGVLGKLPRNHLLHNSWFENYRAHRKQKKCS